MSDPDRTHMLNADGSLTLPAPGWARRHRTGTVVEPAEGISDGRLIVWDDEPRPRVPQVDGLDRGPYR